MKKTITIISALALCACAYAKSSAELVSEYRTLNLSTEATAFVSANKADVKAAFDKWKTTDEAKTGAFPKGDIKARMFYVFATNNPNEVDADPIVLITLGAWNIKTILSQSAPTFYDEAKAAGFVVDGVQLTEKKAEWLARMYGDAEYIKGLPMDYIKKEIIEDKYFADFYLSAMTPVWLSAKDLQEAKSAITEIEIAMLTANVNDELMSRIERVSRALSRRIIDAKLTK